MLERADAEALLARQLQLAHMAQQQLHAGEAQPGAPAPEGAARALHQQHVQAHLQQQLQQLQQLTRMGYASRQYQQQQQQQRQQAAAGCRADAGCAQAGSVRAQPGSTALPVPEAAAGCTHPQPSLCPSSRRQQHAQPLHADQQQLPVECGGGSPRLGGLHEPSWRTLPLRTATGCSSADSTLEDNSTTAASFQTASSSQPLPGAVPAAAAASAASSSSLPCLSPEHALAQQLLLQLGPMGAKPDAPHAVLRNGVDSGGGDGRGDASATRAHGTPCSLPLCRPRRSLHATAPPPLPLPPPDRPALLRVHALAAQASPPPLPACPGVALPSVAAVGAALQRQPPCLVAAAQLHTAHHSHTGAPEPGWHFTPPAPGLATSTSATRLAPPLTTYAGQHPHAAANAAAAPLQPALPLPATDADAAGLSAAPAPAPTTTAAAGACVPLAHAACPPAVVPDACAAAVPPTAPAHEAHAHAQCAGCEEQEGEDSGAETARSSGVTLPPDSSTSRSEPLCEQLAWQVCSMEGCLQGMTHGLLQVHLKAFCEGALVCFRRPTVEKLQCVWRPFVEGPVAGLQMAARLQSVAY